MSWWKCHLFCMFSMKWTRSDRRIQVVTRFKVQNYFQIISKRFHIGFAELTAFERTQQAQAFCRVLGRLLEEDPSCKDMYEIVYFKGKWHRKLTVCIMVKLMCSLPLKIKTWIWQKWFTTMCKTWSRGCFIFYAMSVNWLTCAWFQNHSVYLCAYLGKYRALFWILHFII